MVEQLVVRVYVWVAIVRSMPQQTVSFRFFLIILAQVTVSLTVFQRRQHQLLEQHGLYSRQHQALLACISLATTADFYRPV